jgi:hypothetical protein
MTEVGRCASHSERGPGWRFVQALIGLFSEQPSTNSPRSRFCSKFHDPHLIYQASRDARTLPLSPRFGAPVIYIPATSSYKTLDSGDLTRQSSRYCDVNLDFIGCRPKTHLYSSVLARLHKPAATPRISRLTWEL